MAEFEKGLGHLEARKADEDRENKDRANRALGRSDLMGATFQHGARVRDKVTKELATVIQTNFVHAVAPPREEGVFPLAEGVELEVAIIRTDTGKLLSRNVAELEPEEGASP